VNKPQWRNIVSAILLTEIVWGVGINVVSSVLFNIASTSENIRVAVALMQEYRPVMVIVGNQASCKTATDTFYITLGEDYLTGYTASDAYRIRHQIEPQSVTTEIMACSLSDPNIREKLEVFIRNIYGLV